MGYQTSSALAEFDAWSRTYDRSILQSLLFAPSHRMLLDQLRPTDTRLLDIGCGTGRFLMEAIRRFPEVEGWGLDLSPQMLLQGARRFCSLPAPPQLVRGDSERLPFKDSMFDVVTCSHSFHHYPQQARVVAEIHRVLRPHGRLFLIDGYRDRPFGWFIFDVLVPLAEGAVHHCSAAETRSLFESAGFEMVQQRRRLYPIPFVFTIGEARKAACRESNVRHAA